MKESAIQNFSRADMAAHTYTPNTWKERAERSLGV